MLSRKRFYIAGVVVAAILATFISFFHLLPATPGLTGMQPAKKTTPPKNDSEPVHYRDRVAVLLYHCVSPGQGGRGTITLDRFEADLRVLMKSGYRFIPVSQLAAFLEGKGSVPPNAVVLTFDDGYRQVYDCVFPVLRKYRIPATVFVIGQAIGTHPAFLTWEELRCLEQSGLVTVGGHTFNQHYGVVAPARDTKPATITPRLDRRGVYETEREYEARMLADSRRCQEIMLAKLGHTSPYFAYPYGAYTPSLVRILQSAGYRYMFTVLVGTNAKDQDKARLYRIDAGKPKLSPGGLLETLDYAALNPDRPNGPPAAWWPEKWEE